MEQKESIIPSTYAMDMAKQAWAAMGWSALTPVEVIAMHIQKAMDAVTLEFKMTASASKEG
jgi:hypothetical protein